MAKAPIPPIRSCIATPKAVKEAGKALVAKIKELEPRRAGIPTEELEKRVSHRLDLIHSYLTDETVLGRLAFTSFKDITVAEAIYIDKLMAMRGQPSVIIGHQQHKALDELAPALIAELSKRGMKATLTERKAVIDIDPYTDNNPDQTR